MNYFLIVNTNPQALAQQVQQYLSMGWKPAGGISMSFDHNLKVMNFAQALVK